MSSAETPEEVCSAKDSESDAYDRADSEPEDYLFECRAPEVVGKPHGAAYVPITS